MTSVRSSGVNLPPEVARELASLPVEKQNAAFTWGDANEKT